MQSDEPWKKFKDESTKQDAGDCIEYLLYLIKQLAIFSSPILLDSTQKVAEILGNEDFKNALSENRLLDIYSQDEFTVNLTP
jgi:methionyl-tRNA synthetase